MSNQFNDNNNHVLSHHLIGLSPTFSAYNPLLISTIHNNMLVINGIDAFVILDDDNEKGHDEDEDEDTDTATYLDITCNMNKKKRRLNSSSSSTITPPPHQQKDSNKDVDPVYYYKAKHVLPMNTCLVVGIIQYVHYKSNGSIAMVIDDGTGFIDCIRWLDDYEDQDEEELNIIHAIIRSGSNNNNNNNNAKDAENRKYQVGDLVSIRGQLRILSIDHERKMLLQIQSNNSNPILPTPTTHDSMNDYKEQEHQQSSPKTTTTTTTATTTTMNDYNNDDTAAAPPTLWESYFCTREIQIKFMQRINNDNLNEESLHWMKSLQFIKRIENTKHIRKEPQVKLQIDDANSTPTTGLLGHVKEVDNDYITDEDFCLYNDGWNLRQQSSLVNLPTFDGLDTYNVLSNEMKNIIMMRNHEHEEESASTLATANRTTTTTNMQIRPKYMTEKEYKALSRTDPTEKALRNYFGKRCRCFCQTDQSSSSPSSPSSSSFVPYATELLYCQCIGTTEALDKEWKFRNVLLTKLVQMESIFCQLVSNGNKSKTSNDDDDDVVCNNENKSHSENIKEEPSKTVYFQFKYSTIYENDELQSMAKEVVQSSHTSHNTSTTNHNNSTPQINKIHNNNIHNININIRRLFINTFHHLRKDGILHLLDIDKDIYILLSKTRVLFPMVEKMIMSEERYKFCKQVQVQFGMSSSSSLNHENLFELPPFINNIPQRKINLLKRLFHIKRNNRNDDE